MTNLSQYIDKHCRVELNDTRLYTGKILETSTLPNKNVYIGLLTEFRIYWINVSAIKSITELTNNRV